MTRWIELPQVDISPLSSLNLNPLIAQTLVRRGVQTIDSAQAFINPEAIAPVEFPNIDKAIDRVHQAIRKDEKICVWGDFDVDGQTSTALLVQALRLLKANVQYYIPIRGKESHGVHVESLKPILDGGANLILTCDTGITAHDAIDFARNYGADVIVTDHHDPSDILPNAYAIVNPKLLQEDHPLKHLAGVGVAYKFAEALLPKDNNSETEQLLDLAALGLIADVALLRGETRSIAQKGINVLRKTNRLGLKAMAELSNTQMETLTEETIGFTFAPRLNALGRLSDANPSVELLLTKDAARARVLAAQIEGLNAQRRLLTSQVTDAAEAQLREHPELLTEPVIILSHLNWPGGVVGIVANRLVNRYHKPAILLTESDDGILRGSARSIEGLHITDAIADNRNLLLNFGGHPMAAGMSLQKENLFSFRRGLAKAIENQTGKIIPEEPTLEIDSWLELEKIDINFADTFESLAPFGAGNPKLIFATRNVQLKSISEIGKGKEHLRLNIEDDKGRSQTILWWNGTGETVPEPESRFDIAYSIRAASFRGEKQVSVQYEAFRIVEEPPHEIRSARFDVRDMRGQSPLLNLQPSTLIWAEGPDRAVGLSRNDLTLADELSIYTTPPSRSELKKILSVVKPKTVYVFGNSPLPEKPNEFLEHLAGLTKFVMNQRRGKIKIEELAAAMAARESAVRMGLEWMSAGGHISLEVLDDRLNITKGNGEPNKYLQKELFISLQGILEETTAYRSYFEKADVNKLMELE